MILRAIAPPARREWAPMRSGSMPFSWRLRDLAAARTAATISALWISSQTSLWRTSQSKFSSVPLLDRMWWTLRAREATAPPRPVPSWCSVCPMRPFFWFDIFSVAASAVSKDFRVDRRGRIFPSRQKPTSATRNCTVLVALTIFPFRLILRGLVYSPLRRRKKNPMLTRSPTALRLALEVKYPSFKARAGTAAGTASCGVAGGSVLRNPSSKRFMGRMYSPCVW